VVFRGAGLEDSFRSLGVCVALKTIIQGKKEIHKPESKIEFFWVLKKKKKKKMGGVSPPPRQGERSSQARN